MPKIWKTSVDGANSFGGFVVDGAKGVALVVARRGLDHGLDKRLLSVLVRAVAVVEIGVMLVAASCHVVVPDNGG